MTFDAVYTNNNCTSIYLLHELSAEKKFVITENCTSLKLWVLHLRKYERCFSLLCKHVVNILRNCHVVIPCRGGSRMGAIAPQKPMKVTLFTMVLQIGKQHSRYKAILSSTVLSQQCCEVYFIPLTVAKTLYNLITKYYWNRPSPNLTGWIRPWRHERCKVFFKTKDARKRLSITTSFKCICKVNCFDILFFNFSLVFIHCICLHCYQPAFRTHGIHSLACPALDVTATR